MSLTLGREKKSGNEDDDSNEKSGSSDNGGDENSSSAAKAAEMVTTEDAARATQLEDSAEALTATTPATSPVASYETQVLQHDEDLTCPICLSVFVEPLQAADCGHRFCRRCIKTHLQENKKCPVDYQPLNLDGMFHDKACERRIKKIVVECENRHLGCKWTGAFGDTPKHSLSCSYKNAGCSGGEAIERQANSNTSRPISSVVTVPTAAANVNEVSDVSSTCKFCQREVDVESMACHVESHCQKVYRACPYKSLGCQFRGLNSQLPSHALTCHKRRVAAYRHEISGLQNADLTSWLTSSPSPSSSSSGFSGASRHISDVGGEGGGRKRERREGRVASVGEVLTRVGKHPRGGFCYAPLTQQSSKGNGNERQEEQFL